VPDPYHIAVPTSSLSPLRDALEVLDQHAELNHRYRKLIEESREVLAAEEIRLTQARGIAKRLLVLVKAAGPDFAGELEASERSRLRSGLDQGDDLIRQER
jgi:hypothetical protein